MIELQHVRKQYLGRTVIEDLSLHVVKGRITVVIGSSGSGKSTLLKLVNRLEEHDAGRILFAGREIRSFQPDDLRRRMGYVIQSVGLFPHWTVARNVATVPQLLQWQRARIDKRVDDLLDMLGLPPAEFRLRYPHQLSGGQQQRVGVARALAAEPEVLLMDEPFGALDPLTRASLQAELRRIQRLLGTTVLFITHDMEEALALADHLVLLEGGRIRQQGTPLQLLAHPRDDFVRDFIGHADAGLKLLALLSVKQVMRAGTDAAPPGAHAATLNHSTPPIGLHASLKQALSRFVTEDINALPVQDEQGHVIGHLLAQDVLQARLLVQDAPATASTNSTTPVLEAP